MRSVSIANPLIAAGFTLAPRVYDLLVGPLMSVAGLSRRHVAPHPGNVLAPSEDVGLLPADGETVPAADRLP
jgi:hypothetical protein